MSLISQIVAQGEVHAEQLVSLFREIADNGHVLIVKSDGLRETVRFTSLISIPDNPNQTIRRDANTVLEAVYG